MKITIEFDCDNAAFDEGGVYIELRQVLRQAERKVLDQLAREPATVCDAPESIDKLLDSNGNTVGSVRVAP